MADIVRIFAYLMLSASIGCGEPWSQTKPAKSHLNVLLPEPTDFQEFHLASPSYIVQMANDGTATLSASELNDVWSERLNTRYVDISPLTAMDSVDSHSYEDYPEVTSFFRLDFSSQDEAQAALESLTVDDDFRFAEPNWVSRSQQSEDTGNDFASLALTYDSGMPNAFWLQQIKLSEAFKLIANQRSEKPRTKPIIAVLDSGVDAQHHALREHIFVPESIDDGCGDSNLGCDTTIVGYRYGTPGSWPVGTISHDEACSDELFNVCSHGTRVAGIIASSPQTGYGGICPDCMILPIKVVSHQGPTIGTILDSSIISALGYLIHLKNQGVDIRIVNASFGKFRRSQSVSLLLRRLTQLGSGTLIVAAAGNENASKPQYPAGLDEVLAVANVDSQTGLRHPTSNFGYWVDLSAPGSGICLGKPGSGILSSIPGGSQGCAAGTSFSAPIVSGLAGLILSAYPDLSADELKKRLLSTSDQTIYEHPKNKIYQDQLGMGLVNAANALSSATVIKPSQTSEKKIKAGCGVISNEIPKNSLPHLKLLLIMMPILTLLLCSFTPSLYSRRDQL